METTFSGQNLIVTGTPGADLSQAIPILRRAGYRFLHDKQLYTKNRIEHDFFVETCRNKELVVLLSSIFSGETAYPMQFIQYYSQDVVQRLRAFVAEFSKFHPIAFVDVLIAPYLDLFRPFSNNVVFVRASYDEDVKAIRAACKLIPSDIEIKIRDIALNRAEERLKSFDTVLELDVKELSKLEKTVATVDF
jgi:hypothetical protein